MTDRFKYSKVRQHIIDDLRMDLIGPADPYEVLDENPRFAYLVGMLDVQGEDDSKENEQEIDSDVNFEDEEDYTAGEEDDNEPIMSTRFQLPSSIGISFYISNDTDHILFDVSWGDYTKSSEKIMGKDDKEHNKTIYYRQPMSETLTIDFNDFARSKDYSLKIDSNVHVYVSRISLKGNYSLVTAYVINKRQNADSAAERIMYQVEIKAYSESQNPIFIAEHICRRILATDEFYFEQRPILGRGRGCAAVWDTPVNGKSTYVKSSFIPEYEFPGVSAALKGFDKKYFSTSDMSVKSKKTETISKLNTLADSYEKWIKETLSTNKLMNDPQFKEKIGDLVINRCNEALSRIREGITLIDSDDITFEAFCFMNRVIFLQNSIKRFSKKNGAGISCNFLDFINPKNEENNFGWRPFQIAFILMNLAGIVDPKHKDRNIVDLLYFPTGGGKTEAFLGACVFNMFFDRLRGKNDGITAFLKYPLRLLAVQQLDRVLMIVMKANVVRESSGELAHKTPFQVGFFVGKGNIPNKIDSFERLSERGDKNKAKGLILESDPETLNEYYRFIDTCPYCGKKHVNLRFNRDTWRLEHVCDNPECPIMVLPLMIVDNEIYRYLPSIVVSTIDKMAMLGTRNDFKMLFGQVKKKCPVHGFTGNAKCSCASCGGHVLQNVGLLKDPIPTLFIQDEMHLVKESLGTFDAHYESFLSYYAKELVPEAQRKLIRFVGATATISMYESHIWHLYHMDGRRFPCEYPSAEASEDFYSYTDNNDITRILIGYAPYGRSITDGMWESVYIMRLVVYRMIQFLEESYEKLCAVGFSGSIDEYRDMLYDYWIELVYNNRKQDAMELENAFQNQANNYLEAKGVPKYVIEQMTSDVDFQTVRKTLFDIQANRKNFESTNLLLATSTISHGVDEDSFNVMYFFGMPNNNAEYIQAYSRTGRKFTGIVVDIIRLMRVRDRSYLKNFVIFHQNRDDLVEAVPINRWAKNAIYSTLPGLLAGLIRQYYTIKTNSDSLHNAIKVQKLLRSGEIDVDDAVSKLIAAYGCNEQEKMSLAYKEIITEEAVNILSGIKNGNFTKELSLSDAIGKFSHGKKTPMTSLRDTEEQIEIKI